MFQTRASVVLVLVAACPAAVHADFDFGSLRWKKRAVAVFAPNRAHPALTRQHRILEQASCGVRERDIRIVLAIGEGSLIVDGQSRGSAAASLRSLYRIDADAFEFLLIGKDGAVKLRRQAPVSTDELFARIDAMPMRRSEIRNRGAGPEALARGCSRSADEMLSS